MTKTINRASKTTPTSFLSRRKTAKRLFDDDQLVMRVKRLEKTGRLKPVKFTKNGMTFYSSDNIDELAQELLANV